MRTGAPAGTATSTITVGGVARTYRVYRPRGLPAKAPLVVMLHGGFGDGAQAEESYGWDGEADRNRFVVAYPDGLNRAWNVGAGCCGQPGANRVDDVAFIRAMVEEIAARNGIDRRRVYATGISNGGLLAYRLACDTDLLAAIGPDAATLLGPCNAPAPVSVLHIHGTADERVRFDGGAGAGVARIDGPPVPDVIARWRAVDRCTAPSVETAGLVTTSIATCPDGRAVELITIAGAGHQWPGGVSRPVVQRLLDLDPPSTAIDATDVLWRFFAAHPKPG